MLEPQVAALFVVTGFYDCCCVVLFAVVNCVCVCLCV